MDRASGTLAASREVAPDVPAFEFTKDQIEAEVLGYLKKKHLNDAIILCCGYFRILSEDFLKTCGCPVVNTHPSLLPAFPGMDKKVHAEALQHAAVSGFSVHLVNEKLDGGPVLFQQPVAIDPSWTAEQLRDVVRGEEQYWLPRAWDKLLMSALRADDRNSTAREVRSRLDLHVKTFEGLKS